MVAIATFATFAIFDSVAFTRICLPKPATVMFPEMGWSLRDSWCGHAGRTRQNWFKESRRSAGSGSAPESGCRRSCIWAQKRL